MEIKKQWELVTDSGSHETYRLRVEGGWIYRFAGSLVFVPLLMATKIFED